MCVVTGVFQVGYHSIVSIGHSELNGDMNNERGEREALCIAAIVGLCSQQLLLLAGSARERCNDHRREKEVSFENKRKDIRGYDVDARNDKSDMYIW